MEASVICSSAYLKATSLDSFAIRELLDRQEAEYVDWRSNRKPIRHPFASSKLNSPLQQCLPRERLQASSKPLWLALLEPTQQPEPSKDTTTCVGPASSSQVHRASTAFQRRLSTKGSPDPRPLTRGGGFDQSASTPLLPSIQRARNQGNRLSTAASLTSVKSHLPPQRKKPSAAKRRLQKHLYDFHCTTVFSMAPGEATQAAAADRTALPSVLYAVDDARPTARADSTISPSKAPDIAVIELPPPPEQDDPYVLSGLGVVSSSFFDDLFAFDWTHSDVDRIVRDAVERNRIYAILRHHYRVLVLYFRQYAGKTVLSTTTSPSLASDLLQIPNRLSLLEDLNLPCVDPAKYGITEMPLRREGLITFITLAAKMVAMHSPTSAAQFRLFAAEGIDMSEAVRSLLVDHVVVYAQLQDAAHFRNVFMMDHRRRLRHLLTKHETSLSSFFFDAITITTTATHASSSTAGPMATRVRVRSDSYRVDHVPTPAATTMSFHSFVSVLKTLDVIPSKIARQRRPGVVATSASDTSTASRAVAVTLDENRAMRIFQQCLNLNAELLMGNTRQSQLTYPEFVEALLRVTVTCHETVICHGGLDICPDQHTSEPCRCRTTPPAYDFSAFDDAFETVLMRIQSHGLRQSSKRSNAKMASVRSLLRSTRAPEPQPCAVVMTSEPDASAPTDETVPTPEASRS